MANVEGLDELLKSMDSLALSVQKNLIVRALRKGAEPIRARAEELAPRDEGQLAESMMITVSDQTATGATAKIGPSRTGFYGHIPEFGLANNPAQPFLRPAADEKMDEAVRLVGETLEAGIMKALGGRAEFGSAFGDID